MTEAQFLAIGERSGRSGFGFVRIRNGVSTAFLAPSGTTLRIASKDTDTLTIPALPTGFLAAGDFVAVAYRGTRVFLGEVTSVEQTAGGGSMADERVSCAGPWAKMARCVFRQLWRTGIASYKRSSRLILNQDDSTGSRQSVNVAIGEVLDWGEDACGYTKGTVSVSTVNLPFDECRDITVADAVRRELRYFPKSVTRFDYSGSTPVIDVLRISGGTDAAYMSSVPKQDLTRVYTAHPIDGVDLEFETATEVNGIAYLDISHQRAGNTTETNPNCLYATIRVDGGTSETVTESFKSVTEEIPAGWDSSVDWWLEKHPRLKGLAASQLTVVSGSAERSGAEDAARYPRISANTAGEIESAGLRCRVETFSIQVNIKTADDEENQVMLSMSFLTTNAQGTATSPKTYSWTAATSTSSGEIVPVGLASAILADRSGALRAMKATLALSQSASRVWPQIGDTCEGLILQAFDVDCSSEVATLEFGASEYLSPEDMAALLTNFRNKNKITSSAVRKSGRLSDAGNKVELGGIAPLNSTDWQPGKVAKQTFKQALGNGPSVTIDASSTNGGSINIDTSDLESGDEASFRTIQFADPDGTTQTIKVLATGNINLTDEEIVEPEEKNICDHPEGGNAGVSPNDAEPGSNPGSGSSGAPGAVAGNGGVIADGDTHLGDTDCCGQPGSNNS